MAQPPNAGSGGRLAAVAAEMGVDLPAMRKADAAKLDREKRTVAALESIAADIKLVLAQLQRLAVSL